ncbi:CHAT domain-containing protein [Lutimonas sp.]|uniref:CHAT domain-containing protein n=1 Tax=Lutimonas sp. TaxID=1872403 RepID=UPI003D9BD168
MRKHIAYLILFFLVPVVSLSQSVEGEYVLAQNKKAADLNRAGNFTQANQILDQLLQKLEKEGAKESFFAATYQTKAKVVQSLGHYEESSTLARQSLNISIKSKDSFNMADSYNTIGINHYFESDYDSTTYYYEKSFDIKKRIKTDPYALAVSAYNIALVYDDLGQTEKAMELYKQAESNLLESERKKNFLSDVYVGMALIYFYSGDRSKSALYAEKAMDEGMESYGEYNPNMTFVYTTYANILEAEEKHIEAIALLEKNLKIRKSTYGEYHRWTCETYYDLANSYVLFEKYDQAEAYYKQAIKIGQKINSRQYLANARNYLAQLYLNRGMFLDEAEELLLLSLNTNHTIYGDISDLVAENYLQLARLYKMKEDQDNFELYLEKTLKAAGYETSDLSKVVGPLQVIEALMLMEDWHIEMYEKSREFDHLLAAYELVDHKISLIRHTQNNFSSDRSRVDFANKYREAFEKDLRLCWLLYHESLDKQYLQKAFELSEINRNTTLLKGLQGIKFRAYGNIPKEKLDFEEQTKKDLERVKMDIFFEKSAREPDKLFYKELLDQRIVLSNRLDSLYQVFKKEYPKFKDFEADNDLVDISEVQDVLDDNTQMITYFLGEESLFTFTITKDSISLLRGEISKKLIENTNDFKNHLSKREDVNELSHDLYMFLMGQQLVRDKENIVIIADNVLNYIPFEVLKNSDNSFLVEDYNIHYTGSARLFLELNNEFFKYSSKYDWAGFAPTYDIDNKLISAKNEIDDIASLTDGTKFVGSKAKKDNFLQNNQEYSVLHLAMHAKIDHENPQYNRLIFEDEDLTSSEIYNSKSKANMAVLSACNTGFGKIEKGEGVMSMARAFHFSGIPSIVMSLWKVPDKETKVIMIDFYRFLQKGKSKSEALRLAKLKYLKTNKDTELIHPYYWSGFVINGNADPIEIGESNQIVWYLIAIAFAMILGVAFRRKKRTDIKNSSL